MINTLARIWNGDITPVAYLGTNNKEIKEVIIFLESFKKPQQLKQQGGPRCMCAC